MSQADIDRMLSEAGKYREGGEKQRQRIAARNQLEGYVFSLQQALDNAGDHLSEEGKAAMK